MKMSRQTKWTMGLMIAAAIIATTGMAFAFWTTGYTSATNTTAAPAVTIGSATSKTATTLTLATDSLTTDALVPGDVSVGEGQTQEIEFVVDVTWDDSIGLVDGVTKALTVTCQGITLSDSGELSPEVVALFKFTYDPKTITGGTSNTTPVTITVTMEQPKNQAEYTEVAGKALSFTFEFSVSA